MLWKQYVCTLSILGRFRTACRTRLQTKILLDIDKEGKFCPETFVDSFLGSRVCVAVNFCIYIFFRCALDRSETRVDREKKRKK